jgi:hydroxyacylglutathione hydrolase
VSAGCIPGNLKLIILTNGGLDATGNCAYIRKKYGTRVAVHYSDSEIVEKNVKYLRREWKSPLVNILGRMIIEPLAKKMIAEKELFTPDLCIDEGFDLSAYGFNARIIHVPGYTKGSIGILTPEGDFFSGNTIMNQVGSYISPYVLSTYVELYASIEKLKKLDIKTVYPCMGNPFPMERFMKSQGTRRRR